MVSTPPQPMTRADYMNAERMPENIQGETLLAECQQICDSWGITAAVKLNGNRCTVTHASGQFQCMRWDVMQRLNELALESI